MLDNGSIKRLRQQRFTLALLCMVGIFAVLGLYCWLVMSEGGGSRSQFSKPVKPPELPSDAIPTQQVFNKAVEAKQALLSKEVDSLQTLLKGTKQGEIDRKRETYALLEKIEELERRISEEEPRKQQPPDEESFGCFGAEDLEDAAPPCSLAEIEIEEDGCDLIRNVKHAVPSGTSVRAILLSSLDASCAVDACSDPVPVKLRLLNDGFLPKSVRAKLRGAIILGSAHGNISSERVTIRLSSMTILKPNGDFVDVPIKGFVTGEDGKYGLRGVVVDRSGEMMYNAASAGFLSGVSKALEASLASNLNPCCCTGSFGGERLPARRSDFLEYGGYAGASSAMDELVRYYIRRSEQLQPVIQVAAGRCVDITFLETEGIGDLNADACTSLAHGQRGSEDA